MYCMTMDACAACTIELHQHICIIPTHTHTHTHTHACVQRWIDRDREREEEILCMILMSRYLCMATYTCNVHELCHTQMLHLYAHIHMSLST